MPSASGAGSADSFFFQAGKERLAPAPGLAPGKVVGDFRLIALIGQGGMGQVWEAEQLSLGLRHVALKFVLADHATERRLEQFAREARAGARLRHAGIVTVHGHGTDGGLAWIAMELVGGAWTLRDFLDEMMRATELPAGYDRHVARFVAEIADALAAAHDAGVIHRDLKPQNVLVTPDERPKVSDFGLARITDELALTVTGDFAGTYQYMSPEQVVAGRTGLDHRTDVFSLGVVLYELLTLQRPFQGDTSQQVVAEIVGQDPPDPRALRSRVPRDLAVIAGKALEKDPERRYPSMCALAEDLRRFLAHEPIRARPPTRLDGAFKWIRRHPARSATGAVALAAVIAIAVLLLANVRANRALVRTNSDLERERTEAEASRDEVLRLAALQQLDDLVAEADLLWPARMERAQAYRDWLARAERLVAELPGHRARLAELDADDANAHETPAQRRWWRAQLAKLVDGIVAFADERTGLLSDGTSSVHGWGVRRRLAHALALERDAAGAEAASAWARAADGVREVYGFELAPLPGLLPLGPDPESGLWEFAHLDTGVPPVRGADGRLALGEDAGLVLVLLPGGTFAMGAQSSDAGAPNHDPHAAEDELPVRAITLAPFFLAKHELTQGQWLRFTGVNPSRMTPEEYAPEWNADGEPGSLRLPVEQVSWDTCAAVMARMGLELPSEAQWEHGARGGTDTIWSCGDELVALQDVANLADVHMKGLGGASLLRWEEWDDGHAVQAPVGRYRANAFGLHDVHGNVFEWCADGYDWYPGGAAEDPLADPAASPTRVFRGGGFSNAALDARSANRFDADPGYASQTVGVRPALRLSR